MDSRTYITLLEAHGKERYEQYAKYRVSVPAGSAGPWTIRKFKTKMDLSYLRYARDGRAPGLGEFTALGHKSRGIVMSDTCPEIDDFMQYAVYLRGHVLISGLGLGMAVHILLNQHPAYASAVQSVTVLELDKDVIKLSAAHYRKDPRVTIHNASAFDWEPPKGASYDSAWHDIWDSICEDNVEEFTKLRRKYQRVVAKGKQYCWGQDTIARMRKRSY